MVPDRTVPLPLPVPQAAFPLVQREYPFIVEVADIVREAKEEPPVTVNPVVVALPAVIFPRAESPETLREPKEVPPVTPKDVEVPTVKAREFN